MKGPRQYLKDKALEIASRDDHEIKMAMVLSKAPDLPAISMASYTASKNHGDVLAPFVAVYLYRKFVLWIMWRAIAFVLLINLLAIAAAILFITS